MKTRILVVEDDQALQRVLHDNLSFEGFQVQCASDAHGALEASNSFSPDLVVLDVMLPDGNGFDLCRNLQRGGRTPVIILTARSMKVDKLRGLALGADDYVTKPFDLEELLARIKVVLRRSRPSLKQLTLGSVTIDFESLRATHGGEDIHLSYREFDVLRYLAERRGRVVSRNELLSQIWSYADLPITRSVDHAIARLRKKIERDPRHPRFIHTVHGDGYCLTPEGAAEYVPARQGESDG
jgi:two-component system, OmpR family, alkaline phosphatase synthesis response regulator PhoP